MAQTPNLGIPFLFPHASGIGEYRSLDMIHGILDALFGEETLAYQAAIKAFQTATASDVTLGGDPTITFTSTPVSGLEYRLWLIQPLAGGPYSVTWGSAITWAGGAPPVLSAGAGHKNLIKCIYVNSTIGWCCSMDPNIF